MHCQWNLSHRSLSIPYHLQWGCIKMVQRNNWEEGHRPYHAETLATNPMGTWDICRYLLGLNSRSTWNLMESHRTMVRPMSTGIPKVVAHLPVELWTKPKIYPRNDLVTVWNLTEQVTSRDHQKGKGETKSSKQPCFWGFFFKVFTWGAWSPNKIQIE